ncbi:MAG: putative dsRNA-binding protein [Clostridiales bacterium]|nr:putative dsRNA-binding protein [Clostridiales bacterium]
MLQEAVQSDSKITVRYEIIGESGPDHDKRFSVQALSGNKVIGTGDGKTKKGAEQNAAKNAMMLLGYTV